MAKRETEIEAVEEVPEEAEVATVGQRLRAAREEKGLSLEDLAAQTRIPQRHLESIERADWDALPAPTYTTGFAKSYAGAVGLDRIEIGDQLRAEMGGQRFMANQIETFEPADPRRTMPKSVVFGTIIGLIVIVALMSWLSQRSLEPADEPAETPAATAQSPAPTTAEPQRPAPAVAGQPVVLTASEPVWLQVSEKGGATLFSGMLQAGQTYAVPTTATAPVLKTGKPEALRANVGNQVAPPLGPAATTVNNVSLLAADLMKGGAVPATPAAAAPAPSVSRPRVQPRRTAPAVAAPEPTTGAADTAATTNTAQ